VTRQIPGVNMKKFKVSLTEVQLIVLQNILEDHMDMVTNDKPEDDGTKHNTDFLENLFESLNK
jgi:hypothetical protein